MVVDFTEEINKKVRDKGKVVSALGYLCFFIPIVIEGENQFARFHANQSLLNLILSTLVAYILAMVPGVGIYLLFFIELFCLIFAIRGVILSLLGKARSIPLVGKITLLPYRFPGQ